MLNIYIIMKYVYKYILKAKGILAAPWNTFWLRYAIGK